MKSPSRCGGATFWLTRVLAFTCGDIALPIGFLLLGTGSSLTNLLKAKEFVL
jgi:hypothetical protein